MIEAEKKEEREECEKNCSCGQIPEKEFQAAKSALADLRKQNPESECFKNLTLLDVVVVGKLFMKKLGEKLVPVKIACPANADVPNNKEIGEAENPPKQGGDELNNRKQYGPYDQFD